MSLPSDPVTLWQQLVLRYPVETLLAKVRDQLFSDLERSGCQLPELPEKEPLFWVPAIASILRSLTSEQLNALLYLIDLPEKWHHNLTHSDAYFDQLSEALLYRELVKVYYKLHYSDNQHM